MAQIQRMSVLFLRESGGRNASCITQANTIRSYRKDLYAALGIHSKQELIDLVEAERSSLLVD